MLTFDDLVSKQYLTKFKVDLPGVGSVELNQVSASAAAKIVAESIDLEGDELEEFVSRKAAEFVKGDSVSDEEVEQFRLNLTAKTISLIYQRGLESAAPVPGDLEAAEKN